MRVLYVATDLRDADVLQQEVKKAAPKLVFDVCPGAAEARGRVDRSLGYDVMLLDSSVAESEQLQLIQHVRSKQIPLPIALLAGPSSAPSSALVSAADECITRGPRLAERLGPGLRLAIERYRVVATTLRDNERLKRSEARLRLIIEALPAGVVLVDHTGKILAMNVAGSTLVGTSGPSDVVGRELYSLADAEGAQRLRELVAQALGGERGRAEFVCHGPEGEPRLLGVDALCIQRDETGQGSVLGVLSTATPAASSADPGVEFAFTASAGAMADEQAALEQALETLRGDIERLETEVTTERGRVQQLLAELERARGTSAEHHAQRAALDERSRSASARVEELEARQRDEQAAMEAVASRAGLLSEEAASLRQERQRLAHEADALKQELLEQRRARLELEERIAATDIERERLTSVLSAAQATAGSRVTQLDEEIRGLKASIGSMTVRERALAAELDATKFEASRLRDDLGREGELRGRFEADLERTRGELQAALSAHDADRSSVASRLADLQATLDATTAREQSLRSELDGAAVHRAEIEQAHAALQASLSAREADYNALASRLAELQSAFDATTTSEQSLRNELDAAATHRAEIEQAHGALQASLNAREADYNALASRLAELQSALDAAAATEHALRAEREAAASQRLEADARVGEATERASELDRALAATTERERALTIEMATLGQARAELEARLADVGQRASALEAALTAKTTELEGLAGELAAARFEVGHVRDDLARESETRSRVEADLEARSFDLATLRSSSDADRDVFQGRITELEGELASVRDRERGLEQRVARIGELEASIAEMEARRQAAVGRIAELEERRRDEQSALAAAAQREADLAQELLSVRDEQTRLVGDRDSVALELARERDTRHAAEHELTVTAEELQRTRSDLEARIAARETELASVRAELQSSAQALLAEKDATARAQREGQEAMARLEADLARAQGLLEQAADREATVAAELSSLQEERDTRGRQAFELETVLARERELRIDIQARLQVFERDAADAGARADARVAEMARDHQEVVARLQKLLEQSAAREFQAAALGRPSPADRVRRRPAEKIGQLAAAMATDLNASIADVAEDARRLLAELPDGTTSRARAEQTLQTANRAGQLVRHLLRLSERESRMIPRVEISTLVRSNEALLRQLAGADIDLRFELAAGLPHVECDAEEVVQVLSTLIVTVRGALPLGGVIRVTTQDRGRGDGRRRSDQTLVLTVSAEGYGMIPVATAVCEEVVTRCGGTFNALVDASSSTTSLQASLPAEARSADAAPGWSQTA